MQWDMHAISHAHTHTHIMCVHIQIKYRATPHAIYALSHVHLDRHTLAHRNTETIDHLLYCHRHHPSWRIYNLPLQFCITSHTLVYRIRIVSAWFHTTSTYYYNISTKYYVPYTRYTIRVCVYDV